MLRYRRTIRRVVHINYACDDNIDNDFGSTGWTVTMCACKHRKSFLIEDILKDSKKTHRNLSNEPKEPLTCMSKSEPIEVTRLAEPDIELSKVSLNVEVRRSTYPLYPMPVKAGLHWPYRVKGYSVETRPSPSYYSEPAMTEQLFRSQLASRLMTHPYSIRHTYGFDRGTCFFQSVSVGTESLSLSFII